MNNIRTNYRRPQRNPRPRPENFKQTVGLNRVIETPRSGNSQPKKWTFKQPKSNKDRRRKLKLAIRSLSMIAKIKCTVLIDLARKGSREPILDGIESNAIGIDGRHGRALMQKAIFLARWTPLKVA